MLVEYIIVMLHTNISFIPIHKALKKLSSKQFIINVNKTNGRTLTVYSNIFKINLDLKIIAIQFIKTITSIY